MVISGYQYRHTPIPACLSHSKNQGKYVLITGSDLVIHPVWYLTQKQMQDIVMDRELKNGIVCVAFLGSTPVPSQYETMHLFLSQVPYRVDD